MAFSTTISVSTKGNADIIDITDDVQKIITKQNLNSGIVNIFSPGSTGGVTTMEYEPGLIQDMQNLFKKIAPTDIYYHHNEKWKDGNGHSHLRSALIGPSISVPFEKGDLLLGTWQQIVFIDFDVRERKRKLIIQIIGE